MYATMLRGAYLVRMDQVQMGIETIDQGLGATSEMGALHGRSEYLSWLAEAHLIAGRANEGLKALAGVCSPEKK